MQITLLNKFLILLVLSLSILLGSQEVLGGQLNQPPVADAGPNQTVGDGNCNGQELVTLDGSGSFDPDGDALSFTWTEPPGDSVIATGAQPSVIFATGIHTIGLTVEDPFGSSDSDTVVIKVIACTPVGGEFIPLDATAVLIAGIQTNALSVLSAFVVIGAIAFSVLVITVKRKQN